MRARYPEQYWPDKRVKQYEPRRGWKLYRGLIGARTALTGGRGTVAEFAAAAKQAGLHFLVFLEDFRQLTPEKLRQLDEQCRQHSDSELLLVPGYAIDTNVGNHMFFFGYDLPWPRPECLTGPDRKRLNLQYQDADGQYRLRPVVLTWILDHDLQRHQVGYFQFDNPRAMQMKDLTLYAAAAVFLWRDGRLVEDRIDDFLTTAQGTIPPTPVAVNFVRSPGELRREAAAGHGLTWAQAGSIERLMRDALRWSHQYDGVNVSASNGPVVRAWPWCHRVHVYGGERFVLGRDVLPAPLEVTSDVGLKEIRIYNGRRLFRRFLPGGAKRYRQTLWLPGSVYRILTLVAEDVQGRRAVAFARRHWKVSVPKPVYCGDHVNDCGVGYLAHGPGQFRTNVYPEILAGGTWDGGPKGVRPVVVFEGNHPMVESDLGVEGDRPFNNTPILETADECALVVRSELDRVYDPAIPAVNPWHTYGPMDPSRLIRCTRRYIEFNRPAIRPQPTGWPDQAVRAGAIIARFESHVTFKRDQTVKRLRLVQSKWSQVWPVFLAFGDGGDRPRVINFQEAKGRVRQRVELGQWFGLYSTEVSNSVLMLNVGEPVEVGVLIGRKSVLVRIEAADLAGKRVKAGETHHFALLSVSDPVDASQRGPERFRRILECLSQAEGLEIRRGMPQPGIGWLRIEAEDGVVELLMPQPKRRRDMPLAVQISGLNPRWSAGLFQIKGHSMGYYTDCRDVYTPLGFDHDGNAYLSLFPDQAELTRVVAGHPIVCDRPELFIEAVPRPVAPGKLKWHIAVNNPTDQPIEATFHQAMDLPGLEFARIRRVIPGGAAIVLRP
ncbi:MAG: hypothetical protein GXP27_01685 [Planctomycetes bacterium]|nr:hypothetical protein [Planctomycetota bacterium]